MSQKHSTLVTDSLFSAGYAPGPHFDQLVSKAVSSQRQRPNQRFYFPSAFVLSTEILVSNFLDSWIGKDLIMSEVEEIIEDSFGSDGVAVLSRIFPKNIKPGNFYFSGGLLSKLGESEGFKGVFRRFLRSSFGSPFKKSDVLHFINEYTTSKRKRRRLLWESKKIFSDCSFKAPETGQYFINEEGYLWRWSMPT